MLRLVVHDRVRSLDLSSSRPQLRLQHQSVGLVHLPRAEWFSRRTQLRARRKHRAAWSPTTHDLDDTCRCEGAEARGAEAYSLLQDRVSRFEIATSWTDICTGPNSVTDLDSVVALDNELMLDDRV